MGQDLLQKSIETVAAYLKRHRSLWRAAAIVVPALDAESYVRWLIDERRPSLSPAAWRQYRCAAKAGLGQMAETGALDEVESKRLQAELDRAKTYPRPNSEARCRTSQMKLKGIPELDRLCAYVLATGRSANRPPLARFLFASDAAGLRPCEWPSASFEERQSGPYRYVLCVVNAKHTNGRAHGERRTLYWRTLPKRRAASIIATIAEAKLQTEMGRYERWLATLRSLFARVTREYFKSSRAANGKFPTLYSGRHAAAARWKQHYMSGARSREDFERGAASVAALLGQASDATSTHHYGRSRRGGAVGLESVPEPDSAEVARVRKRLLAERQFIAEPKGANHSARNHK
jgi:hypothetical protein